MREVALIVIFEKAENPKRYDLVISIVQITIIWSLTLAWAVYGLTLECEHGLTLCKIQTIYIAVDLIVVFFCVMIYP